MDLLRMHLKSVQESTIDPAIVNDKKKVSNGSKKENRQKELLGLKSASFIGFFSPNACFCSDSVVLNTTYLFLSMNR